MKKFLILTIAILAVSFTSCKKDNNENETTNPFVGTWALESYIDNGQDKTTDCERKERVVFTSNTITINESFVETTGSCLSDLTELTYTYTNGKISAKEKKSGDEVDSFMTFTLENGMLVVTEVDDNSKTVIKYKKQ